jgi:multicomponent Na+:H+ antiporter subunit B
MKRIIAILLTVAVGIFIFTGLYGEDSDFKTFGEKSLSDTVANSYVEKNVDPESDSPESGSANVVTSIVVNYRSFDTLGEVTVLFVSALGVALLGGVLKDKVAFAVKPGFILKNGMKIISGIILITGIYIFIHGHLSPGGGFPGGAMIGSSFLLMYLSDEEFKTKITAFKIMEGTAGSLILIIGLAGLSIGGYFLYNFLPNGNVGDLISAGIVPILYVLVGLKVGSEVSNLLGNFLNGEVE